MRKKAFIFSIWVVVMVAVAFLYFRREVSPVNEFVAWAVSIWPILALICSLAETLSVWVIKHDFSSKSGITEKSLIVYDLEEGITDIKFKVTSHRLMCSR